VRVTAGQLIPSAARAQLTGQRARYLACLRSAPTFKVERVEMAQRLTIPMIESTRAVEAEVWLSDDDGSRGSGRLSLRVTVAGTRRFYFRYSVQGRRQLIPIGYYTRVAREGYFTLEQAREAARGYAQVHRVPITADVRAILASQSTASAAPQAGGAHASLPTQVGTQTAKVLTLAKLCQNYVDHLAGRGAQSANASRSYFQVHIKPSEWANVPATEFTAEQATELLRRVVNAKKITTAQHVRQLMHAAYELARHAKLDPMKPAVEGGVQVTLNPISLTKSLAREQKPRSRPPLSKLELGHLWNRLSAERYRLDVAVRAVRLILLLGGQRGLQLLRCRLTEVDLDNNTLLIYDGKGRRPVAKPHLLPLTSTARTEVLALRQIAHDLGSGWLVPGKFAEKALTDGPVSRAIGRIADALLEEKKLREPFRYANLRSTVESTMASLDITRFDRGQVQSHGTSGIQEKHYDRYEYLPQKRAALLAWEQYLISASTAARSAKAPQD
jgi:integrase